MKYIDKVAGKNQKIKQIFFAFEFTSVIATCVVVLVYFYTSAQVKAEKHQSLPFEEQGRESRQLVTNCSVIIPNQEISNNCENLDEGQFANISGYCSNRSSHCPLCLSTTGFAPNGESKPLFFDLNCISKQLAEHSWIGNLGNVHDFRHELEKYVNSREDLIITQKNLNNITMKRSNQIIPGASKYFKSLTKFIYNYLPKESPFKLDKIGYFSKCSVIGSSSLLSHSRCGKDINKSDFVFRCNAPPIKNPFADDVGSYSTFTTLNINSVVEKRYKGVITSEHKRKFFDDMQQYGRGWAWITCLGAMNARVPAVRAFNTLNLWRRSKVTAILEHPYHHKAVNNFWKTRLNFNEEKHGPKFISTGLYMATVALSMCNETHLYGFWPFERNGEGEKTFYHYYDSLKISQNHEFYKEFIYLFELHRKGIVKLHYGNC